MCSILNHATFTICVQIGSFTTDLRQKIRAVYILNVSL